MTPTSSPAARARPIAAAVVVIGLMAAVPLLQPGGPGWMPALVAHALLPLVGLTILLWGTQFRIAALGGGLLVASALILGLEQIRGGARMADAILAGHVVFGLAAVAFGLAAWSGGTGRARLAGAVFILCLLGPLAAYGTAQHQRAHWEVPAYDQESSFRFLTATTVEQSDEPNFPSALRLSGQPENCQSAGCHATVHADPHAGAGAGAAYLATYRDFTRRRGTAAGRWCQGCHFPHSQQGPTGSGSGGIACGDCHGAAEVRALHGSASLTIRGGETEDLTRWETRIAPAAHRFRTLHSGMTASPELCAACHRKNFNLAQNAFHWMPGPDEYRQWQTSAASADSLFAAGEAGVRRTCVDCHALHGERPEVPKAPLELDLFVRRAGEPGRPASDIGALRAGEAVDLDVLVRNAGIGHDFPYGMPDQQESWVEVQALDPAGKPVASASQTARYTLDALDREGKPIRHGDLDRMTTVGEWRRIGFRETDLVRCRLRVPAAGVKTLRLRVLRRLRPEFAAWVGVPLSEPKVVAERTLAFAPEKSEADRATRFRRYGVALGRARLFPEAIAALNESLRSNARDGETLLALGQIFFAEGDLLEGGDRFREAAAYLPDRARAWEAAVLRRSGQPQPALDLLTPLLRAYPRDVRLRYEAGLALMELLRHEEAARQFQALLNVDPLEVTGHFNLMRCYQRLNRQPEARREEALYNLLSPPEQGSGGEAESTSSPAAPRTFDLREVHR
ncbi:MAG TPA: tetratricopeptide repeat protein [Gemmatimonadales bacterium]|nr:tetratricopeptide repeat protein [Gemmatimonadales bacterium]